MKSVCIVQKIFIGQAKRRKNKLKRRSKSYEKRAAIKIPVKKVTKKGSKWKRKRKGKGKLKI